MTKKKTIPAKLLALCLALMLTVSMALTAAAAPITSDNQSGTITVQGLASDEGAQVSVYKIIDVHFDADAQQPYEPVYVWNAAVANWVAENYPDYIDEDNGNAVTKAFNYNLDAKDKKDFYVALGAVINTLQTPATDAQTLAAPDYAVDFTVEMGQYIALATKAGSNYDPASANLVPTYNEGTHKWELNPVEVALKGEGSSIDKDVQDPDDNTVAIGDEVGYRLDALIPIYPGDAVAKRFTMGDRLSKGLTLDPSSIIVKVGNDVETAKTVVNTDNKYYTVTIQDPTDLEKGGFDIKFNYDALVADFEGTHAYVEYNATVNEFAFEEDALGNSSYVGVNTDPYDDSSYDENPGEDKEIYTYGVTVNKVDEDQNPLSGAEFKLYSDADLQNEIKFVQTADGTYRVAKADEEGAETLVVDSDGVLNLQGLDLGTYYLKEIKAPGGYNLLQNALEIKLTDTDKNGELDNDADNVLTGIQVVNSKGFNLPVTGGIGTVLFTVVGVVLMASGVLLVLVYRKKRQNSDR